MQTVSLALFWHQHQPYYPDDVAGTNPMPWVRLHATKDYLGMALHLAEVPEFHCTINLVPSLLEQLEAYGRGASDTHLDLSRRPADGLDEIASLELLDSFFMAFAETMIKPHERYFELYQLRSSWSDPARAALNRFRTRDIRDLQVWSNLAWIHPLVFEKDPELAEFKRKGRFYTEEDKAWLLERQMDLLGMVVPLHRALAEGGQIELTTTPYYHPILPLLLDKTSAREAMPDVNLPRFRGGRPEDIEFHLKAAVESHEARFGRRPRGMWPSEGSVSQALVPFLARRGIEWIATDEEILGCSTGGMIGRDGRGHVRRPELLYRPWKVSESGHELAMVFRDHSMSDQIGFHYQRSPGYAAADDFLGKLHRIGDACRDHPATLVTVALDGENCWEYYPDGGVAFLRSLYQGAARDPRINPTKVGTFLDNHPPTDRLSRLFAGSWINHDFAIWIGHPEDNKGWDALDRAREFLEGEQAAGRHDAATLERAWREIHIAQGSDWFWWYGDDHSSALDALFDDLFRKHLRNVYTLLSHDPPGDLYVPISGSAAWRAPLAPPKSFCNVRVDGRASYFEWVDASRHDCVGERGGAMAMASKGMLESVWFGFDAERLLIRLDAQGASAAERLGEADRVRIGFVDPPGREILVVEPGAPRPTAYLNQAGKVIANGATISTATGQILELALPFRRLDLSPGDPIRFYVEVLRDNASIDRAPREGILELQTPSIDFERINWQV